MHDDLGDLKTMVIARFRTAMVATHLMDNPESYIEAALDGLTTYLDALSNIEVLDINEVMGERLRATP